MRLYLQSHPLVTPLLNRLKASPLGYRLAKGTFWSLVAIALPKLITLIGFMLVARILGKNEFGALGIIQNTVGMLGTFAGFGFGITATKYVSQYRGNDNAKAGRIVGVSVIFSLSIACVTAAFLYLTASYISIHWLASPGLVNSLRISSLLLIFSALNGVQMGTMAGLEDFKKTAIVSIWVSAFSLIAVVGAIFGVNGAVWSLVATAAFNCAVTGVVLKGALRSVNIEIHYSGSWRERSVVFHYSLPAILANTLYTPVFWFCTTLLVNRPNGYGEMGEFNAASQWRNVAILIPSIIGQVTIPIVSECCANGRKSEAVAMLIRIFRLLVLMSVPIFGLLCFSSGLIMTLYGAAFKTGWLAFCILQAAVLLQILQSPIIKYMEANGLLWINLVFNAGQGAFMVGATVLLVDLGAKGLALAILISFIAHSVWLGAYAMRVYRSTKKGVDQFREEEIEAGA
jgi:O-antigen/teichoic acid export membrane protein